MGQQRSGGECAGQQARVGKAVGGLGEDHRPNEKGWIVVRREVGARQGQTKSVVRAREREGRARGVARPGPPRMMPAVLPDEMLGFHKKLREMEEGRRVELTQQEKDWMGAFRE